MAEQGHGHSPAAWTAVGTLLVAALLICLSVIVTSWPMAIVGLVLVVAGVVAGKVLAMAGFGQTRSDQPRATTVIR